MASLFDSSPPRESASTAAAASPARSAAWTIAGVATAPDPEVAEDLAGLSRDQLQRLAGRLGLYSRGTAGELRTALLHLVTQPGAPIGGSRQLQ